MGDSDDIELDIDGLADHLAGGGQLIDVREPDEYERGHVPGAISIPLVTVPDHLAAFGAAGRTAVICQGGGRSRRACEFVGDRGIDAVNVAGGTGAWIAAGREVVVGDEPT